MAAIFFLMVVNELALEVLLLVLMMPGYYCLTYLLFFACFVNSNDICRQKVMQNVDALRLAPKRRWIIDGRRSSSLALCTCT